jgi:hypothetical protein
MRHKKKEDYFLKNEHGVTEEFTSLPALSIVMIGVTLFLFLLSQSYDAHQTRMMQLQRYQEAYQLLQKFTNPNSPWIRSEGIVDLPYLLQHNEILRNLQEQYQTSGICFILRLDYDKNINEFPEPFPNATKNRVAVNMELGVYLNDAQTLPGTLTLILWRNTP